MLSHADLNTRTIIRGKLKSITQFRVGESDEDPLVGQDLPVMKTTILMNGSLVQVPFIPSSTLKGIIRQEYSRIVTSLDNESSQPGDWEEVIFGYGYKEWKNMSNSKREILKSKSFKGLMKIKDALPVFLEKTSFEIPVRLKTSTRINRKRRTVEKGMLFTMEAVQPQVEFDLLIIIENIDSESQGFQILKFIISEISSGRICIGSRTSSGLGAFTIEDLKITHLKGEEIIKELEKH